MTRDHYLVPFGREPGGLLEFLGLPVTASDREIGDRRAAAEKEIETSAKKKRVEINQQLKEGAITEAEREERIAKNKDEESAAKMKLRDLSNTYEAKKAQLRGAARQNRSVAEAGWVELAGVEVTEELLLARRPLPRMDDAALAKIRNKPAANPHTLAGVILWRIHRDLAPLLEADDVWSAVAGTDRAYWQQRIAGWRREIEAEEPHFSIAGMARKADPELAHLARGRKLAVKKLDVSEPEIDRRTRRGPEAGVPFSLEALAELLRVADGDRPAEAEPGPLAGIPPHIRALMELLAGGPPLPAPQPPAKRRRRNA